MLPNILYICRENLQREMWTKIINYAAWLSLFLLITAVGQSASTVRINSRTPSRVVSTVTQQSQQDSDGNQAQSINRVAVASEIVGISSSYDSSKSKYATKFSALAHCYLQHSAVATSANLRHTESPLINTVAYYIFALRKIVI